MSNPPHARKVCCFCRSSKNDELEYGKFYNHDDIVTHYYCLLLSSNMEQRGKDHQGILGFLATDIKKEIRRGKRLVCSYCKKGGATLGCCNIKCKKIFHYPCGRRAGSLNQFFGEFRSYCINCRPKRKIDTQVLKEVASSKEEIVCYICYEQVDPYDSISTMWAPCCKKNAWFHRKCVQQLALSAGYFFKCPLCNDKKAFQKAMLEYGIFIPSQDASWELVPNAFQELLFRHDQCDAPVCICPKGRKYTSFNARWELVLCRTCGSQGIHMTCGELKWANPIWECRECISILAKSNEPASSSTPRAILQNISESEDSDSDISVGKDSPIPFSSTLPPTTSTLPVSTINQNAGPRSVKLDQLQLSSEMQDTGKKEVNKKANTSSNTVRAEQYSRQSTSGKEILTNKSNLEADTTLHDNRGDFNFSIEHSKSRDHKADNSIITLDSDDDETVEVIGCTPLNDIFVINCESKNNASVINKRRMSHDSSPSKKERSLQRSDSNNILINNLNTTESSSRNQIMFHDFCDSIRSNHETGYTNNCLFSDIKITSVVSLAPEEFENVPPVNNDGKTNKLEYSGLQRNNGLISNGSTSKLLSSKDDSSESNLKRKLDQSVTISVVNNESKKLKQTDSVIGGTSYSSLASLANCTRVASNSSNLQIIDTTKGPLNVVFGSQNRMSDIEIKPVPSMDGNKTRTNNSSRHSLKMNVSNNLLNIGTDAFSTLANEGSSSACTLAVNRTIKSYENIKESSDPRNCAGNAGTSLAIESRSGSLANDEQIICTEEHCTTSYSATSSDSKGSNESEPWNVQTEGEMDTRKRSRTSSHDKSSICWQGRPTDTECNYARLIPEFVRLRDLKFRVNNTNNLQMIFYDKFSININMECATTMKSNTTFNNTVEKKIAQQNVCKPQNETSTNFRSGNILRSMSPVINKEKSKFTLIDEQPENYEDDTKENLHPHTISCKNISDKLLTNATSTTNNSKVFPKSGDGNLTQSVSKVVIEDDDEGRNHDNNNLIDDSKNNSNITISDNCRCSKCICDSAAKLSQRESFYRSYTNHLRHNVESANETDLKVSIDLKKIQNFVDDNPDLFLKHQRN